MSIERCNTVQVIVDWFEKEFTTFGNNLNMTGITKGFIFKADDLQVIEKDFVTDCAKRFLLAN